MSSSPSNRVDVLNTEFILSWPRWKKGELEPLPQICFIGRSNVGKSSLLNCVAGRKALARVSRTPGRTQAINVFRATLRRGEERRDVYLVDLPGYGYAKAPQSVRAAWRPMMESYLKKNPDLRAAVALLDIRHKPTGQDLDLFEILENFEVPTLPVATKTDKVGSTHRRKHLKDIAKVLDIEPGDIRTVSSATRHGIDGLLDEFFEVCGEESDDDEPILVDEVP